MSQDPNPELQALREELQKTRLAYQMATEMSQFQGGFLARTAHELRSPLSSLIGLHQLILSDLCDDPAEEREFIQQAHQSALKLVKLLDEVIAISKAEHGTNQLEIQPLNLAKILQEVHNLVHLQAANRSLNLQILPADPEIYILADPKSLRQLLATLVDAAIGVLRDGSITISAQVLPVAKTVQIWIDVQRSVEVWSEPIDLFKSEVEPSESKDSEFKLSPGLNLAIAQKLIELMDGRLEIVPADSPTASATVNLTKLQCTLPLANRELAWLEPEEN